MFARLPLFLARQPSFQTDGQRTALRLRSGVGRAGRMPNDLRFLGAVQLGVQGGADRGAGR